MKNIILTIFGLLLISCTGYSQKLNIQNASESQTIVLKNNKNGKVYALNISVSGNVKGKAKIILMEDEKPYKTENITGNFNFKWGGDWYSDNATIIYKATNVSEGNITMEYKFGTL